MEREPKKEPTVSDFEGFLSVKLADDITKEDINRIGSRSDTFVFVVSPEFKIFISQTSHNRIFNVYGVDSDTTLVEGYIDMRRNQPASITLKSDLH